MHREWHDCASPARSRLPAPSPVCEVDAGDVSPCCVKFTPRRGCWPACVFRRCTHIQFQGPLIKRFGLSSERPYEAPPYFSSIDQGCRMALKPHLLCGCFSLVASGNYETHGKSYISCILRLVAGAIPNFIGHFSHVASRLPAVL